MAEADFPRFFDPELWTELRGIIVPAVYPLFQEAFMVGAELGAMQRPVPVRDDSVLETGLRAAGDGVRPNIQPGDATINPYDAGVIAEAASRIVADFTSDWWEIFDEATKRTAQRIIANGARLGLTNAQITKQLEPLFGPVRAQRVAVSELTDLMGMGAQETYRLAGYEFWQWRTVRDSQVDEICRGRSGKRYRISVRFRKAHINCRCWPVPYGKPNAALLNPSVFA